MAAVVVQWRHCGLKRFLSSSSTHSNNTIDENEIRQFSANSAKWWDRYGEFALLHRMNPIRIQFLKDVHAAHQNWTVTPVLALRDRTLVDIGCGGGLFTEAAARLGATVVGVDASASNVDVARQHATFDPELNIQYRADPAEKLVEEGQQFDIVTALEVIEHVSDPTSFVKTCSSLMKPDGLILFSTINRTPFAYATTIAAAEHILGWVSTGTHTYKKFITPDELDKLLQQHGLRSIAQSGMAYNPLTGRWSLTSIMAANYLIAAIKA